MAEREKITQKGKDEKIARLKQLTEVEKPAILAKLNAAREQGDLSENADYDAAREKAQEIEAEIQRIQYTLDHVEVIEGNSLSDDVAHLGGGAITVQNLSNGSTYTFTIVGPSEAKPIAKISNNSPVALAVIGHKAGDEVEVEVEKPYKLKIIKIGE